MATNRNAWFERNGRVKPSRSWDFHVTAETVLLALFIGGLAWVPFWLGSNRLLPWAINAVVFPGLLVVYELFHHLSRCATSSAGAIHPHPCRLVCDRDYLDCHPKRNLDAV